VFPSGVGCDGSTVSALEVGAEGTGMLRNAVAIIVLMAGMARGDIVWTTSLEAARRATPDRPVVLYFTSESCGWCRKMESGTFTDAEVQKSAEKFTCVKVDVKDAEELAARYRVRGVPAFVVLDARGKLLANQPGYQPAAKFAKFLEEALTHPMAPVDELDVLVNDWAAVTDKPVSRELVERTITRLAKADRAQRTELLKLVTNRAEAVQAHLVELMGSNKLAIRAAAFEALKEGTKLRHPFDPFSPADVRQKQLAAWQTALGKSGE
jgi:thioredoxin-like negative regulator of GroEL